jgi:hypothetical protein
VPGLVGHVASGDPDAGAKRFGAALDRMRRHPGLSVHASSGRGWRLGDVSLAVLRPADADGRTGTSPVVFHGVLHNETALRSRLRQAGSIDSLDALLFELYRQLGPEFVGHLEASSVWRCSTMPASG